MPAAPTRDVVVGPAPLSDERPVRAEDEQVAVSPSKVESFRRCELRWFLEHVGGGDTAGAAQSVGTLVHAVAEARPRRRRRSTEEALQARLEALLPTVDLGSGWVAAQGAREGRGHGPAAGALAGRRTGREVVATELAFAAAVGRARLGGRVDRLERDDRGRAVVVDLKTGIEQGAEPTSCPSTRSSRPTSSPSRPAPSTGLAESGGAELVQVGKAGGQGLRRAGASSRCPTATTPAGPATLVLEVAEGMAGSAFRAVDNRYCAMLPGAHQLPGAGRRPDGDRHEPDAPAARRAGQGQPSLFDPTPRPRGPAHAGRAGRPARRVHPPTPSRPAAITAPLRPHVVVAGAGSGKTQTMGLRVVWLVANGLVEPHRVLGLTFTRKAAAELGERVRRMLRAAAAAHEHVAVPRPTTSPLRCAPASRP